MSHPWWQFWKEESSAKAPATPLPKETKQDGYQNLLTGLGVANKDKRLAATFGTEWMGYEECRQLWRGNDIAATIVERIPSDMLRMGFDIKLGDQAEQLGPKIKAKLDDLQFIPALLKALQYMRAYGGGALWLGVDDGQTDLTQPLNPNNIRSFNWIEVYAAGREIQAARWNYDGASRNCGKPETYRIVGNGRNVEVHYTRLILFAGPILDRQHQQERQGFGDSVFVRIKEVLSDFGQSFAAVPILISDFSQSVYKFKDLAMMMVGNQEDKVVARVQAMDLLRSILRGIIIDKDEDFARLSTPVAGLDGLLDKETFRVAAAAKIPATLLFGQAPAGLNATGDSDIRNYYDGIANEQESTLRAPLEKVIRFMFLAKDGPTKGKEPAVWSVGFRSLWQLTEEQKANLRNKQANTDSVYITCGVLKPNEVALSRFGGDDYSVETDIDVEARKKEPEPPIPAPKNGALPS